MSKAKSSDGIELRPDGWKRFEKAVDVALHTKPMHRETPKPTKKKAKAAKRPAR